MAKEEKEIEFDSRKYKVKLHLVKNGFDKLIGEKP